MPAALPIDDVLPDVVAAVRERGVAVLVAPPGAGKTTRVPGALLDAGVVDGRDRRAAAAAARRAARRRAGRERARRRARRARSATRCASTARSRGATRIRFVTEGVLTRRLLADPELRGVGAVIIDEFHERHLDGDLALALVERLRARRPELALS